MIALIDMIGPRKQGVEGAAPKVLVVDDDSDVLTSLGKGLSEAGYAVSLAASGNEAVRILEDRPDAFDVAVIDLVLPDTWGPQMAVAHSELQPDMKVIYISGHGDDDEVLKASSTQSDDVTFLAKPFTLDDLVELIERQLGGEASRSSEGG